MGDSHGYKGHVFPAKSHAAYPDATPVFAGKSVCKKHRLQRELLEQHRSKIPVLYLISVDYIESISMNMIPKQIWLRLVKIV